MAKNIAIGASEISTFSADGVIAEMMVEVDIDTDSETISTLSDDVNSGYHNSFRDLKGQNNSNENVYKSGNSTESSSEVDVYFCENVTSCSGASAFKPSITLLPIPIKKEADDAEVTDSTCFNFDVGGKRVDPSQRDKTVNWALEKKKLLNSIGLVAKDNESDLEKKKLVQQQTTRNAEFDESKYKNSLRELPVRKTTKPPDKAIAQPNIICENFVGPGNGFKLGSIADICDRIRGMRKHGLRPLYRVLFFRWPPNDMNDVIYQVLQFNGFPFSETSFEYTKRKSVLKMLHESTLTNICYVLGIKPGLKKEMMDNVIRFLMKPVKKLNPLVDITLQPFVPLMKIDLDPNFKYVKKQLKYLKKKALRRDNLRAIFDAPRTRSKVLKASLENVGIKKLTKFEEYRQNGKSLNKKIPVENRTTRQKNRLTNKLNSIKKKLYCADFDDEDKINENQQDRLSNKLNSIKRKLFDTDSETFDDKYVKVRRSESTDWVQNTLLSELQCVDNKEEMGTKDEDDVTSQEKPMTEEQEQLPRKGDKLGSFSQIKESVSSANHSVLQRLHVLLFGSSDQTESIQSNILNFNGFSFSAWSDDWDQKKFLLSLISMNMLREYVEILHLANADGSPSSLIDNLMQFLTTPSKALLEDNSTDDDDTSAKAKEFIPKQKFNVCVKVEPKAGNKVGRRKKEIKPKVPRNRKRLMDEAEVRKMELEIAREQRAKRRSNLQETRYMLNVRYRQTTTPNCNLKIPSMALMNDYSSAFINKPLSEMEDGKVKLESNPHVKFMVVTLNYPDLEILHHLIFLQGSTKSKIRRNILDFDGFSFDEFSIKYKMRMIVLNRLSYDIVKRIAFILGLTSYSTRTSHGDLNTLIMRFLMSPSKIKQIPIKEFPHNFFQDYPKEFPGKEIFLDWAEIAQNECSTSLALPTNMSDSRTTMPTVAPAALVKPINKTIKSVTKSITEKAKIGNPAHSVKPSPKKFLSKFKRDLSTMRHNSFFKENNSSGGIPIAEVITCDPVKINATTQEKRLLDGSSVAKENNSIAEPDIPLKKENNSTEGPEILSKMANVSHQTVQKNPLSTNTNLPKVCSNENQNVPIKHILLNPNKKNTTIQLIKIPSDHPLLTAWKSNQNSLQSGTSTFLYLKPKTTEVPSIQISGNVAKQPNVSVQSLPRPTVLQLRCVPSQNQTERTVLPLPNTLIASDIRESIPNNDNEEYILSDINKPAEESIISSDDEVQEVPVVNLVGHPSDEVLIAKIQQIILSTNLEGVTLRNILERISQQYPNCDLNYRREFIKTAVKKMICGIPDSSVPVS